MTEETDYIIEIPELEGQDVPSGVPIKLSGLETETPRMEIGSLKFIGQHQHIIGTSVVIDNSSVQASSSVPEVVAMAKRRIVFRRIAGSINALQSGAVATASSHSSNAVLELTADNLDSFTAEGDWIIEFYAPWCIHCQRLSPHLETAAKELAGTTNIGKVDGPAWRSLTFRFNVVGYPSLFHIHNSADGREVRKLNIQHTVDGVKYGATKGWKDSQLLNWFSGPFGPYQLAKFYGLKYGERVFKIHEPISKALDIPPIIVQFVVGMLMMCGFVGAMIGFAVWLGPKKSRDEDEHED